MWGGKTTSLKRAAGRGLDREAAHRDFTYQSEGTPKGDQRTHKKTQEEEEHRKDWSSRKQICAMNRRKFRADIRRINAAGPGSYAGLCQSEAAADRDVAKVQAREERMQGNENISIRDCIRPS